MTHRGKIARLPNEVREELNRRLRDGAAGKELVAWLNSLPVAQAVLAAEFRGRPIREQNLSKWRRSGYRDWLATQEALAEVRRAADGEQEFKGAGQGVLTGHLATFVAARYAVAASQLERKDGKPDMKELSRLCQDVSRLRREDHDAAWLRLELEKEKRRKQGNDAGANT
jgi:hypothetical protein